MAKFGSLYIGVKPDNDDNALMLQYFKYFCLRRLAFAGLVAFGQDYLVFQVMLMTHLCLFMSAYAIVKKPMEVYLNNLVFIGNELFLLFSSYFILTFSLYVPALQIRYDFGFAYLVIFGLTTAWNITLLMILVIRDIYEMFRLRKVKK